MLIFFPSYLIDKLLNIHLYHNLFFLFQPIIERPDNITYGRNPRGREFIRNGYYLLRLLVMRNPQEVGDAPRTQLKENYENNARNEVYNEKLAPHFPTGEYLTHVDTVIRARANFANMYVPIQFNTEQLLYLGSRNYLSIQMLPADPREFVFNLNRKNNECELDLKRTQWKPFLDHDLETIPFSGPFTPQNWTNWNVLQPTPNLKTDKIIEQSETGKKFKYFNIDSVSKTSPAPSKPISIIDGKKTVCTQESLKSEEFTSSDCFKENDNSLLASNIEKKSAEILNPINKDGEKISSQVEDFEPDKVMENFSDLNALKIVDLSKRDEANKIVEDLNETSQFVEGKIESLFNENLSGSWNLFSQNIVEKYLNNILDKDTVSVLKADFEKTCKGDKAKKYLKERGFLSKVLDTIKKAVDSDYSYNRCIVFRLRQYLNEEVNNFDANKGDAFNLSKILSDKINKAHVSSIYSPSFKNNEAFVKKLLALVLEKQNLKQLESVVEIGVSPKNAVHPSVGSFIHNLCAFWFKKYFSEYLKSKQMVSAYTNHIRKFDYITVLNSDFVNQESINLKKSLTSLYKNPNLKKCHVKYTQCLVNEHCSVKTSQSSKIGFNSICQSKVKDRSCKTLLENHCSNGGSDPLCIEGLHAKEEKQCVVKMKRYCTKNPLKTICGEYYNKCSTNYKGCTKEASVHFENLKQENPFQAIREEFLKQGAFLDDDDISYHPFKTCLANPFEFFNFENKMIVKDVDKNHVKYKDGLLFTFSVGNSHSIGTYMNWTAQRSTSVSAALDVSVKTGLRLDLGGKLGASSGVSSNESNSGRRAVDARVIEGAYLTVSRSTVEIGVKKFRKCLVVKPRPNAFYSFLTDEGVREAYEEDDVWNESFYDNDFNKIMLSKPGLMICNPEEEREDGNPEIIQENYYYISQSNAGPENVQFINMYDILNRPFLLVLRGNSEFLKYFYLVRTVLEGRNDETGALNRDLNSPPMNMFIDYTKSVEETAGLSINLREFKETGFYEGIYTYSYNNFMDNAETIKEAGFFKDLFEKAHENAQVWFLPKTPESPMGYQ